MTTPLRIGLTGGIASGKSTAALMFAELGVPLIDTDVIAREVVEPGQSGLRQLEEAFGAGILDSSGRLDRRRMRERVFTSDETRTRVGAILHPLIREQMQQQSAAAGGPYQIIVVPLLVESGLESMFDRVLVVDCPREMQLARLLTRDDEASRQAEAMLDSQASRKERLAAADEVIVNDGDLANLRAQVEALHARYSSLARREQDLPSSPS